MERQDRTIRCATCGREFLFTVKEQGFFISKGFREPRHCRECRQQRKQSQVQAAEQIVGAPPQQRSGKWAFKITCAKCQRETFVPFKPITGKPVLCKDCFIAQKYGAAGAAFVDRSAGKSAPPSQVSERESAQPQPDRTEPAPEAGVSEPPPAATPDGEIPVPPPDVASPQDQPETPQGDFPASENDDYGLAAQKPEGQDE